MRREQSIHCDRNDAKRVWSSEPQIHRPFSEYSARDVLSTHGERD
jgi:hypothetical protein